MARKRGEDYEFNRESAAEAEAVRRASKDSYGRLLFPGEIPRGRDDPFEEDLEQGRRFYTTKPTVTIDGRKYVQSDTDWRTRGQIYGNIINQIGATEADTRYDPRYGNLLAADVDEKFSKAYGDTYNDDSFFSDNGGFGAFSQTIGPALGFTGAMGALGFTGAGSSLFGDAAAAASTGAGGAAANTAGLTQMATEAGLTGAAADAFVASGGGLGSSAGGGAFMDAAPWGVSQQGGDVFDWDDLLQEFDGFDPGSGADNFGAGEFPTMGNDALWGPGQQPFAGSDAIETMWKAVQQTGGETTANEAAKQLGYGGFHELLAATNPASLSTAGNAAAFLQKLGLNGAAKALTSGNGAGGALSGLFGGENGGLGTLAAMGLLGGGLLEDPDRTTTTSTQYPAWYEGASQKALGLADTYAAQGAGSVAPLSANEQTAGALASSSAGAHTPYIDRAGALTGEAAAGIPGVDLNAYMNPYIDSVLSPILRRGKIEKAQTLADLNAKSGMHNAFGGSRHALLSNLAGESADRNLNETEANVRSGAFNTALNTAGTDLSRKLGAGAQYGALGGALSKLTGDDITRLSSTGETARSVEQAKLNAPLAGIAAYKGALPAPAGVGKTVTQVGPAGSKIGQLTGALAALSALY